LSTSLESAGGGGEKLIGDAYNDGLVGGNGGVNNTDSAALDNSPPALTRDEMVDFFFNSSAETSKATLASVQVCSNCVILPFDL